MTRKTRANLVALIESKLQEAHRLLEQLGEMIEGEL